MPKARAASSVVIGMTFLAGLGCAPTEAFSGIVDQASGEAPADGVSPLFEPYADTIPGTLVVYEMVPVEGGSVAVEGPGGTRTEEVAPLFIGRTEVTWDMFDVFMFGLDEPDQYPAADALARPSEPYDVPDYGWGRSGFAAISVTYHSAQAFAEWLSAKTGRRYRLPTEAEWVHAATLAKGGAATTGDWIDRRAWHRENSDGRTHPVGSLEPDQLGLYDLFGNAAEWVVSDEVMPMVRGGSFRDDPSEIGVESWAVQDLRWTERDPQLPRSTWWLTDAPFVGFRLVREP